MDRLHFVRGVLIALFGFAATVWCNASQQPPSGPSAAPAPLPVIVALGDSITAGYHLKPKESFPAVLQQRLAAEGYPHRVVNAGRAGDTTAGAVRRLDRALVLDTRILIVALGANDGLRGISPEVVESNLSQIIERAQARGAEVLLCASGFEYTLAFQSIFTRLSDRYHVTRVPFLMVDVVGHPDLTLSDRLHPNAAGARLIAERIWPYLQPVLQK